MGPMIIIGIVVVLICISISIGAGAAAEVCNKTACNNVMSDWIKNKYWAFGDTANSFGECKKCESRWFTAPFLISKDGTTWTQNANKDAAYNAVAL